MTQSVKRKWQLSQFSADNLTVGGLNSEVLMSDPKVGNISKDPKAFVDAFTTTFKNGLEIKKDTTQVKPIDARGTNYLTLGDMDLSKYPFRIKF